MKRKVRADDHVVKLYHAGGTVAVCDTDESIANLRGHEMLCAVRPTDTRATRPDVGASLAVVGGVHG